MSTANSTQFRLIVGRTYPMTGDVTTLASVANQSPGQIERRIGYQDGRLKAGYSILFLVQKVAVDDFIWGDQTRFSGRWQFRRDIDEYVQRVDLFRSELAKKHNYDSNMVDAELYEFLGRQQNKLNIRSGLDRIVKIFPNTPHDNLKNREEQYPNSPIGQIPQWTISREKNMICVANVLPGAVYRQNATL